MQPTVLAAGNILLPNGTFFAELLAFLIVLFVLRRFVVPPLQKAMNQRQQLIRTQLEEAEAAKVRLEAAEQEYRQSIADTKAEAASIREEARAQGQSILDELRARAQQEADRITARGEAQLVAERQQTVTALRAEIGQLAVELAERIVGSSLADESRQHAVIERFLDDLESSAPAEGDGRTPARSSAGPADPGRPRVPGGSS